MKFNRSSWHYKFNSFIGTRYGTESINGLCVYFWYTLLNLLKALGMACAAVFVSFCLLLCLHFAIAFLLGAFGIFYMGDSYLGGLYLMGIGCAATSIIGISEYISGNIDFAPHYMTRHFTKTIKVVDNKAPSLVKEYYKATKSKICPIIEWE